VVTARNGREPRTRIMMPIPNQGVPGHFPELGMETGLRAPGAGVKSIPNSGNDLWTP